MTAIRYIRPLLPSWEDYRSVKRTWRGDIFAGITVGIIALPLALAFGVSSGAGAESGLITAIAIGIGVATFFALRSLAKSGGVHREELPTPAQPGDNHIALFRPDGALFFGVAGRMLERVTAIRNVAVVTSLRHQMHLFVDLSAAVEHARSHVAQDASAAIARAKPSRENG